MLISKERVFAFAAFGGAAYLVHSYLRSPEEDEVNDVAKQTFSAIDYSEFKKSVSLGKRVSPPAGNPANTSPVTEVPILPASVLTKVRVGSEFVTLYQKIKSYEGTKWIDTLISSLEFEDKTKVTVQQLLRAVKEVVENPDNFRFVTRQAVNDALIVFGKDYYKETLPKYFHSEILEKENFCLRYIPHPVIGDCILSERVKTLFNNLDVEKWEELDLQSSWTSQLTEEAILIHCLQLDVSQKVKKLAQQAVTHHFTHKVMLNL